MAKQHLIEQRLYTSKDYRKVETPLTEAEQNLVVSGSAYRALAVYRFDFTRPGQKNLNGRIYPYSLWDKVIIEWKGRSTLGLMDHPADGPGNPKDVWCVWRNIAYSENRQTCIADCYIIDNENGRTIKGILDAGGDIGLSSSGYGDFELDGITVAADTFELERVADAVMEPSYQVYTDYNSKVSEAKPAQKINEPLKVKESGGKMNVLSLREKRDFELSMKRIYEDVKTIKDPIARLGRAEESIKFFEEVDVTAGKKEFEDLVKEAQDEMKELIKKAEDVDATKKAVDDAAVKAEDVEKENDEIKKENEDLKEKIKALQETVSHYERLTREADSIIRDFSETAKRQVSWDDYQKLHEYAERATILYSRKKQEHAELEVTAKGSVDYLTEKSALSERRLLALAEKNERERLAYEEKKSQATEAQRILASKVAEAKMNESLDKATPEVAAYYDDLVRMGEGVDEVKDLLLSKKTLSEAQLCFLKYKHRKSTDLDSFKEHYSQDLSIPIAPSRIGTTLKTQVSLPKGFL